LPVSSSPHLRHRLPLPSRPPYVAIEVPEAATFIRGTAELVDGKAEIALPEHFGLVTCDAGMTVNLTPVGGWLQLYVEESTPKRLVVRDASGKDGTFHYLVQGVQKGYDNFQVVRDRRPEPEDDTHTAALDTDEAANPM